MCEVMSSVSLSGITRHASFVICGVKPINRSAVVMFSIALNTEICQTRDGTIREKVGKMCPPAAQIIDRNRTVPMMLKNRWINAARFALRLAGIDAINMVRVVPSPEPITK